MITITKNEEVVLNQIEIYAREYPDGVPLNILRKELGFHEYDLVQILEELQDKDLIIFAESDLKFSVTHVEMSSENLFRSSMTNAFREGLSSRNLSNHAVMLFR